VLALAAAYFGAHHVTAVDIDPASVEAAKRNAFNNDLHTRCDFSTAQLGKLAPDFDVAVANIDALTLRGMAPELCARVGSGGSIGITGVLGEQQHEVSVAFGACGVPLIPIDAEGEWVLLGTRP
jgi:ribosomal protein L11 methyltransferase